MTIFRMHTVRPEFTGTLAIKAGRHPVLSIMKTAGALVPNDAYCCDSSTFQLIRGPKLSTAAVSSLLSRWCHSISLSDVLFRRSMSGAWFMQHRHNRMVKFRVAPLVSDVNTVGKSTYLRQVGLLTIMGMCGCFVPAEYASFR